MIRAGVVAGLFALGCGAGAKPLDIERDVQPAPKTEVGPEAKAMSDAIVHAFELLTEDSAMPADATRVRAAAITAIGYTAPVPWTMDAAKDRDLLRGALRATALRGTLPPDAVLRAVRAMALASDDFHTFAMTKAGQAALFGVIAGIPVVQPGVLVHRLDPTKWAASTVIPRGAADAAGVQPGDELVSIDGTPIAHGWHDLAYLYGVAPGTEAKLVVRRGNSESALVLRMTAVALPQLEARVVSGPIKVGYVRLVACTHSDDARLDAEAQLARALADFDKQRVTRLVLDLRGNAGGFPFDVASLLVDADPLMYGIASGGAAGGEQPVARTHVAAWKHKYATAVLIDDATASGAEMIALALRDFAAAKLVGQPSAGGLTFPTTEKLGGDVMLTYPLSRAGSASTKAVLEGNRLAPDIAVANRTAADFAAHRDPQLDAALAALH